MLPNFINAEELNEYYEKIQANENYFKENDINELNANGSTLLFFAVLSSHEDLVNILIDNGIDVNIINKSQFTALTWIKEKGILEKIFSSPLLNKEKVFKYIFQDIESEIYSDADIFLNCIEKFKDYLKAAPELEVLTLISNLYYHHKEQPTLLKKWNNFTEENKLPNYTTLQVFSYLFENIREATPYQFLNQQVTEKEKAEISVVGKDFTKSQELVSIYLQELNKVVSLKDTKATLKFLKDNQTFREINKILTIHSDTELNDLKKMQEEELLELTLNFLEDVKKGGVNAKGIPTYIASGQGIEDLIFHWQKVIHAVMSKETQKSCQELVQKYDLKALAIDKDYKIETVTFFLDKTLEKFCENSQIENTSVGKGLLNISLIRKDDTDENDSAGYFMMNEESIIIFGDRDWMLPIHLFKEKLEEQMNDFLYTFSHEFVHFMQYLSVDKSRHVKNLIKNEDLDLIYTKTFKNEWDKIKEIIYSNKQYEMEECIDYLITLIPAISISEEKTYNAENLADIKKHILAYFDIGSPASIKHIKRIIAKDNKEPTYETEDFLIDIDVLKHGYKNQKKSSMQYAMWDFFDKMDSEIYYNDNAEVHARLVSEVIFNEPYCGLVNLNPLDKSLKENLKEELLSFNKLFSNEKEVKCIEKSQLKPKLKI